MMSRDSKESVAGMDRGRCFMVGAHHISMILKEKNVDEALF